MDYVLFSLCCCVGPFLILAIGILIFAHKKMDQHSGVSWSKEYRASDLCWNEDNRAVPRWYTTQFIGEDGTVYPYPFHPRPKMGREL